MSAFQDLTGMVFGRWTVLKYSGNYRYLCRCECGAEKLIRSDSLKSGQTKSCGCLSAEISRIIHEKYPKESRRLRSIYLSMMYRCYNQRSSRYQRYGGRGIRVCDEWTGENGFDNFCRWSIANGYDPDATSAEMTIDRIDNDGMYCPANCRWTSRTKNIRNRSITAYFTYNGETKAVADWAEIFGVPYTVFYRRVIRLGWTVERAISIPVVPRKRP